MFGVVLGSVRRPVVAGRFYSGDSESLRDQVRDCFLDEHGPGNVPEVGVRSGNVLGIVSPHAGYSYSGPVAAHGFSFLARFGSPDRVIVLGPNHSRSGAGVSVGESDVWRTPLGDVSVDSQFCEKIVKGSEFAELDSSGHEGEHSIEVQVPFLQFLFGEDFELVPVCLKNQSREVVRDLGGVLSDLVEGDSLIVASSDFTHYEELEVAREKDSRAIELVRGLDWEGFFDLVLEENLSICGYGPVSILGFVASELDVGEGEVLKYATSGDIGGPRSQVVGYCSIGFGRD